ncbi:hypothetical protein Acsp01_69690 [Actinoplanes sp. NBRC 101535]|nr:hypothetical protein Acsp01_69690 [Actinoplanes sp. NBRC 101535]
MVTRLLIALAVVLGVAGLGGDTPAPGPCGSAPDDGGSTLTPYPAMAGRDFLRGASLDPDGDPAATGATLRTMRDRFGIGTAGLYRLDDPGPVLAALEELGMTAVVRLEEYDPQTFAFTTADADRLVERYRDLLGRLGEAGARSRVAYLAVTMPLDDPRVQARLGGVNSPASVARQAEYAVAVTSRLRAAAPGLPVYLGVFYGWDGAYRPPSYAGAGADGYFLTQYSYPRGDAPGAADGDDALIDARARHAVMRRFLDQYGDAPVVIEYGVQTTGGPAQEAGLVRDRAAKRRALAATTRFYCAGYPSVRGTMYFGFDIHKSEGEPSTVTDFGLV